MTQPAAFGESLKLVARGGRIVWRFIVTLGSN